MAESSSLLEPPTADTTIAVMLGASEYPQKPAWSNPVLGASARAVRDYLRSSTGLGMRAPQILDLFDVGGGPPDQLFQIAQFLKITGASARDLIVYYVGHGCFDQDDYCLGIRATQHYQEFISTIESRKLARIIREGFSRKRVYVILDSCFAASAARDWQGDEIDLAVKKMGQPLPRQGTAFLAAASKYDVTRAPRENRYTVFTGAMLDALAGGIERAQPRISLYDVYEEVRDRLQSQVSDEEARPELYIPSQKDGDVSRLDLFPNAAYPRIVEARARVESDVRRVRAEAEGRRMHAEETTRARAEAEARVQAEADARAQAEADARAQAEADARAQADADALAQAKAEALALAQAEAEERARAKAEVRTQAEAETRALAEEAEPEARVVRARTDAEGEASRVEAEVEVRRAEVNVEVRRVEAELDTRRVEGEVENAQRPPEVDARPQRTPTARRHAERRRQEQTEEEEGEAERTEAQMVPAATLTSVAPESGDTRVPVQPMQMPALLNRLREAKNARLLRKLVLAGGLTLLAIAGKTALSIHIIDNVSDGMMILGIAWGLLLGVLSVGGARMGRAIHAVEHEPKQVRELLFWCATREIQIRVRDGGLSINAKDDWRELLATLAARCPNVLRYLDGGLIQSRSDG